MWKPNEKKKFKESNTDKKINSSNKISCQVLVDEQSALASNDCDINNCLEEDNEICLVDMLEMNFSNNKYASAGRYDFLMYGEDWYEMSGHSCAERFNNSLIKAELEHLLRKLCDSDRKREISTGEFSTVISFMCFCYYDFRAEWAFRLFL